MRKFTKRFFYKPLIASALLMASMGSHAQYCVPVSLYGCELSDDINSFSVIGENNTSIKDLNTGCSTDGYANKTALPAVDFGQGGTYSAGISSEYEGDYAAIWIDFNNNSTFESTELVGFFNQFVSTISSSVNITIPALAPLGNHRMRVLVYYPGDSEEITSSDVNACNNGNSVYDYGETQDYVVNIVTAPACPLPSVAGVSNITSNAATITWTGTGNYIVEYGPAGFMPGVSAAAGGGTIINQAMSPLTISNLTPSTTYDFYVRHDCSATSNGYSSNIPVLGVKTPAIPPQNNLCSGATILTSGVTCNPVLGTTVNATVSGDNSDCEFNGNFGDVWYSFVASHTEHDINVGNITATNTSQYDSYFGMAMYSGNCGGLSEQLGCVKAELYDEASTQTSAHLSNLTIGETYFIRFWKDVIYNGDYDEISGDFTFNMCLLDPPPPPVNDACANAITIPVSTGAQTQAVMATLSGATIEDGAGKPTCSTAALANDVWFTVTVPASGNVAIQPSVLIDNVATDLIMQVYSGSCGALTEIACNDDGSSGSVNEYEPLIGLTNFTPGTVLYVRVTPYDYSNEGQFLITAWDSLLQISIPAPIVLKSISAQNEGASNLVNWSTGVEDRGDYFELERSADGRQFAILDKIAGKGKNTAYEYVDDNPLAGINYYRLKVSAAKGSYFYSNVVIAKALVSNVPEISVYPNPTSHYLLLKVKGSGEGTVKITDVSGRSVYQAQVTGSQINIDMSAFVNGCYLIHYSNGVINKVIKVNKE